MELIEILRGVELFEGLSEEELKKVASLCMKRTFQENQIIARQDSHGEELFIIQEGFVEVAVQTQGGRKVIVNLGNGQTIGEMSLIDQGRRSATVRALSSPTIVQIIEQPDFAQLCESECRIGYIVMQNIAIDLSFRLRQRNINDIIRG
ncbi:MAG TPA: cyclic nucleotide-binding domain-containing protein [Anaerolineales bacterium]|nr:cyclic nucleotide-binding domain-containing protein [Anaerolineales bacterium]